MPVLRVESAERSVQFYCGRLGFRQDWWHQAGPEEPATVSVSRGGASLILTERSDLGIGSQMLLWTIELGTLFVEWGALADVVLEHGPTAMPWGLTEMTLRDPDGNAHPGGAADGVSDMITFESDPIRLSHVGALPASCSPCRRRPPARSPVAAQAPAARPTSRVGPDLQRQGPHRLGEGRQGTVDRRGRRHPTASA